VMSTAINEQQQATGLVSRVFPADTRQVYAVLTLEGVDIGTEITGRWYQLSVQDAPPDGAEVSSAGVRLDEDNIFERNARVALNLSGGAGALPEGDWVVRVYADGKFVRTMAFVVTRAVTVQPNQGTSGQPAAQPSPTVAAQQQSYTVASGDSLASIAQRFKPASEATEAYVARLVQLNNLQPNANLTVGQVLRLP
jgi:LysM repeat protein